MNIPSAVTERRQYSMVDSNDHYYHCHHYCSKIIIVIENVTAHAFTRKLVFNGPEVQRTHIQR